MADLSRNEVSMVRSKKCFKCVTVKPITEFYKHPMMGDGHLGKCKDCTKTDVRSHRLLNIEKIRAYDRERAKLPHNVASRRERSKLPHMKALQAALNKEWRQADRRRTKCHNALIRAVRSGFIKKMACVMCGSQKSQAHHPDYDKPLDVMWLCPKCHRKEHDRMKTQILLKT